MKENMNSILKNCNLIFLLCFSLGLKANPVSFTEQEVVFFSSNVKLSGTLFIPQGDRVFPAIVVTHGSEKASRSAQGYRSVAEKFTSIGYIVLLFDKRGVGDSEGEYIEMPDLHVPANDLIAAVDFLASNKFVDTTRIGVYGHSQGAWVASLAASNNKIKFAIVSCGGAITLLEQDLFHYRTTLRVKGYSVGSIDSIVGLSRILFTYLSNGEEYNKTKSEYEKATQQTWFKFFKEMGFSEKLPPPSMLSNSIFDFFRNISYDPTDDLKRINIPCLVLLAENDQTVPTPLCKSAWENTFKSCNKQNLLSIVLMKKENHYNFEQVKDNITFKESFSNPIFKWLKQNIK